MHELQEDLSQAPDTLPTEGRVLIKAAAIYDLVQPLVTLGQENKLNRWVAKQLKPEPGHRILDVGCGTGLMTYEIADLHPDCEVVGIDASKPMLQVAQDKRTLSNCSYRQAVAEDLPFESESYDIVTSALFFHHVNRELKIRALEEIHRILKPGGTLLIADMDVPYTTLGWAMSWTAWKLFRQPEIKENMDGLLRELVKETGFTAPTVMDRFSGYITVFSAQKEVS